MLPIVDKPVIQYVVEEAVRCGIEDVLIVTGRGKRAIENHFDYSPGLEAHLERQGKPDQARLVREIGMHVNIYFIRQKEQKGLGDAVSLGRKFVGDEPFAVMLGDTIIQPSEETGRDGLQELMDTYSELGKSVVAVRRVADELVSRYGIVDGDPIRGENLYKLRQLIEKPSIKEAPTNLAIAGRYVFTPDLFQYLERTEAGKDGEIQLTDAMNHLAREDAVHALAWQATRYDIGDRADYVRCFLDFAIRRPETRQAVLTFLEEQSSRGQ